MLPIKPFAFDITDEEIDAFTRESAKILRSGILILGEYTSRFEQAFAEFIGVQHAITVNSGTSALEILLRLKGVTDKTVLVSTNTNFATAAAVLWAGG
jgi:perosamine synthetase